MPDQERPPRIADQFDVSFAEADTLAKEAILEAYQDDPILASAFYYAERKDGQQYEGNLDHASEVLAMIPPTIQRLKAGAGARGVGIHPNNIAPRLSGLEGVRQHFMDWAESYDVPYVHAGAGLSQRNAARIARLEAAVFGA